MGLKGICEGVENRGHWCRGRESGQEQQGREGAWPTFAHPTPEICSTVTISVSAHVLELCPERRVEGTLL